MRGLLCIEPLYHAIVAGRKTQTRRSGGLDAVNGCKATKKKAAIIANPDNWEITGYTGDDNTMEEVDFCDFKDTQRNIHCKPRYRVGEVLFLKEPTGQGLRPSNQFETIYKFDNTGEHPYNGWSNKLFMPATAARAYVRVASIKCERLLDISDKDCIAEGIEKYSNSEWFTFYQKGRFSTAATAKISFCSLYQFANKMNPSTPIPNLWVWAYEFEYLKDYQP